VIKAQQREKAQALRAMHDRSQVLVLPNVWDAISARIVEQAGARAIATTSAGVAYSLGYPDGEFVPRDDFVRAVARIARVVQVPLTADIESGFGTSEKELEKTVRAIIDAGAVGINLEDSTGDPARPLYDLDVALARLAAARATGETAGVPLVINARTDALMVLKGEREALLEEAVRRANAYRAAGADCLFPLGLDSEEEIAKVARFINGPVNVIFRPGVPPVARLKELGVARLSLGSAMMLSTMTHTRRIAQEVVGSGTYSLLGGGIGYPEANKLMTGAQNT
jgi:2-methylisocitrate lyase-like PEP mutase family enzyme